MRFVSGHRKTSDPEFLEITLRQVYRESLHLNRKIFFSINQNRNILSWDSLSTESLFSYQTTLFVLTRISNGFKPLEESQESWIAILPDPGGRGIGYIGSRSGRGTLSSPRLHVPVNTPQLSRYFDVFPSSLESRRCPHTQWPSKPWPLPCPKC